MQAITIFRHPHGKNQIDFRDGLLVCRENSDHYREVILKLYPEDMRALAGKLNALATLLDDGTPRPVNYGQGGLLSDL